MSGGDSPGNTHVLIVITVEQLRGECKVQGVIDDEFWRGVGEV
jgi:hypothetical protein